VSDVVLDASLALQWFLENEAGRQYGLSILGSLSAKRAVVRALWFALSTAATAELCSAWTGEGARPHTATSKINGGGQECPPYTGDASPCS